MNDPALRGSNSWQVKKIVIIKSVLQSKNV